MALRARRPRHEAGSGAAAASLRRPPPPPAAAKPVRIKVLTMGKAASGKSCLVKRFCEEKFITKYISTIGVDYGVKPVMVNGTSVRVNFWDLSGKTEYLEIRNEFYKDTQAALLVYDVTDRSSFDALEEWLDEAAKFGARIPPLPVSLCANKVDKRREVSEAEGQAFANAHGFEYYETSAATGANVQELFEVMFNKLIPKSGK